jgi:hypothetical protein
MYRIFWSSIIRWSTYALLNLLILSATPGSAQFGGDAFSAGDTAVTPSRAYYVEYPPIRPVLCSVAANKSQVGIPANSDSAGDAFTAYAPSVFGGDAFSQPTESTDCTVIPTCTMITGSQTDTWCVRGGTVILQGATNGTIGPQSYDGPWNIIFLNSHPILRQVRSALNELGAPRASVLLPVASSPTVAPGASQKTILKEIHRLELVRTIRQKRYKVLARAGKQRSSILWANVFGEENPGRLVAELYTRAAGLEKKVERRHFYLGAAACYRKNWDVAWTNFEQVYKLAKDNPETISEVAGIYRKFFERDLELCIWLTRYLRAAPTWEAFSVAFSERGRIEQFYSDERIRNERGPNITWESHKMPLKVYFPDSEKAGYDKRLKDTFRECMFEWIQAMEGKIDYVETRNIEKADIICEWQDRDSERPYDIQLQSNRAPQGHPHIPRVGNTVIFEGRNSRGETHLVRAIVGIIADQGAAMRTVDDDELRAKCMHEIGHALGIKKHLYQISNCMYPYIDVMQLNLELSGDDKQTIFMDYKSHPVNQKAVDKFIGMTAIAKRLHSGELTANIPH